MARIRVRVKAGGKVRGKVRFKVRAKVRAPRPTESRGSWASVTRTVAVQRADAS